MRKYAFLALAMVAVLSLTMGCEMPGSGNGGNQSAQENVLSAFDRAIEHQNYHEEGTISFVMGLGSYGTMESSGTFSMYKQGEDSMTDTTMTVSLAGQTQTQRMKTYIIDGETSTCTDAAGEWACTAGTSSTELISPTSGLGSDAAESKLVYNQLIDSGAITFTDSGTETYAGRQCDFVAMDFDISKMGSVFGSLLGGGADSSDFEEAADMIDLYKVSQCMDKVTGQNLYSKIEMEMTQENQTITMDVTVEATEFEENPTVPAGTFELPTGDSGDGTDGGTDDGTDDDGMGIDDGADDGVDDYVPGEYDLAECIVAANDCKTATALDEYASCESCYTHCVDPTGESEDSTDNYVHCIMGEPEQIV
ncbi:MAG: hypothetical protein V1911_04325 [Candidatus Micrarchaeota archaeon]